jgi:hypothetical protein
MEGRLPVRKLGRGRTHAWLVRLDDVERFLRETRRGPKPKRPAAPVRPGQPPQPGQAG